ncbi:MAG: ABC transporter permease [Oscillospiraceae bacterium]
MLRAYCDTFMKYRFLLSNLIVRDLKVKYRRSILGVLWSLLNPILMMLILTAVFSRVFRYSIPNLPLYIISGQTLYTFFSEATTSANYSIIDAASLIKKVYIPKYIFPLEKMLFAFVNLGFSLSAIAVMLVIFRIPLSWSMLLFPIPLISMLGFAIGFGMILSALCVFFRDLKHLYSVMIMAWMYMTPIIYPMSTLDGSWLKYVALVNPLTWYIEYFRAVVMYGQFPTLEMNLICIGYALVFLFLGFWVFKRTQDKFILYI